MRIKNIIKKISSLSPEDRAEFNRINTKYNSGATLLLSAIIAVMLSGSMLVGYMSYSAGAEGVNEFWLILPYHAACIALSVVVFIVMLIVKKMQKSEHIISDIVAVIQIFVIMALFLISSHVEIPVIGIKNVNANIISMFALGFFLRFRISVTLVLEALYVVAVVLFLFIEKSYIPNFYPSLINVVCSFVLASCAAFMYWNSRKNNFLSTKKLETLASSDYLTRLHNRRSFDAYIECEWQHVRNENLCISLFFIDVDHFKKYNDFYGHPEGDKCLCAIADIIATSVRKSDFAARYGGEEFVVSLTGANEEIAKRVANDILNAMRDHKIPHEASVVPYVTLSIGCMICHPGKRGDIGMEDFMQMADDALYMAKEQGRDRIVFHPESAIH